MKKIYVLLVVLISLTFSLEIVASNNQVTSKYVGCTSISGKGVATFVVKSPVAQSCDLSFLMMPGEYEDGSFTRVTISVNGDRLIDPIICYSYGWQVVNSRGNQVNLNEGDNIVQFISWREDIPQIREVKVWTPEITNPFLQNLRNVTINDGEIVNNIVEEELNYLSQNSYIYINPNEPLYRPGVEELIKYAYTPVIDLYITPRVNPNTGERLPLIVDLIAPTSPYFNEQYESTIDYNVYLFYKSDPSVYSESFYTTNHNFLSLHNILPREGEYCLILEPKSTYESGYASIVVNNVIYRHCYMYPNMTVEVRGEDVANNIYTSSQDSIFNMFTTNNLYTDTITHTPDPILFLKQKVITGQDTSNIIVAYNDDNNVRTNFDWKKNARIRTKLDSTKQYFITTCSSLPYIRASNIDECILYHSYWNNIDTLVYSGFKDRFPKLKYEDAIESGKCNMSYNCYAWSAGIMYNHLAGLSIEDFDLLYSNRDFYNMYGKTRRPPMSPIYIRDGATYENAVIDLWGDITEDNDTIIRHASVRNPYSGIPNGYDWESKDAYFYRFFHPRDALEGPTYGDILYHYRLAPGQENVQYSYEGILYSSIADGEMIIEDTQLTKEEKTFLSQSIITTYRQDKFEQYYSQWKKNIKENSYYSNSEFDKDSIFYTCLVDYILSNPGEEYKVYKKFDEGDYFAAVLIKDISSVEGTREKKVWDRIMNAPLEGNIVRTSWGNVRLFIKTMLQDESIETLPQTGKIRSNEDDVKIHTNNGGITVSVGIDKTSTYCIKAVNLQTAQNLLLLPESSHQAGKEIYQ